MTEQEILDKYAAIGKQLMDLYTELAVAEIQPFVKTCLEKGIDTAIKVMQDAAMFASLGLVIGLAEKARVAGHKEPEHSAVKKAFQFGKTIRVPYQPKKEQEKEQADGNKV